MILYLISHILQCRISCWRPVSEGVTASLPCPAEFRGIAYDTSSQYEPCSNFARFLKKNCKYVFKLKLAWAKQSLHFPSSFQWCTPCSSAGCFLSANIEIKLSENNNIFPLSESAFLDCLESSGSTWPLWANKSNYTACVPRWATHS